MKQPLNNSVSRWVPPNAGEFLIDDRELAQKTGISRSSWQKDRLSGRSGLPFVKIGRRVRYRLSDVESWLSAQQSRKSTSDQGAAA